VTIIGNNRVGRMNALTMVSHEELDKAIEVEDKHYHMRMIVNTNAGKL